MRKPAPKLDCRDFTAEVVAWKSLTLHSIMKKIRPANTWNRAGLEAITLVAQHHFNEICGRKDWRGHVPVLPHNLFYYGPAVNFPNAAMHIRERRDEIVSTYARFAGWIRAAETLPALKRFIQRTQSPNGVNSPRTKCDLWKVAERYPSPGNLNRKIERIRWRAEQVLKPWGLHVSRDAIAETIEHGPRSIGKAAIFVAALTIEQYASWRDVNLGYRYAIRNYRVARTYLIRARGLRETIAAPPEWRGWAGLRVRSEEYPDLRAAIAAAPDVLTWDYSDGFKTAVDMKRLLNMHSISVMPYYAKNAGGILIRSGNLSYHFSHYGPSPSLKEILDGIRVALRAWKAQRAAAKLSAMKWSDLLPSDRTVLVYIQDSLDAGNCLPGTRNFAAQHGWAGRELVPAEWLVKHASPGSAVERVLKLVAQK